MSYQQTFQRSLSQVHYEVREMKLMQITSKQANSSVAEPGVRLVLSKANLREEDAVGVSLKDVWLWRLRCLLNRAPSSLALVYLITFLVFARVILPWSLFGTFGIGFLLHPAFIFSLLHTLFFASITTAILGVITVTSFSLFGSAKRITHDQEKSCPTPSI